MATKDETLKHISKLFQNQVHKSDAAGNYHDYPLQSLFTIVHGSPKNGFVDLSVSSKMKLTKGDFKIDKTYPSMKLTWLGTNTKWQYAVQIKEPKDFKKTTGGDFKQIIIGYEKSLNNHVYKNEHRFHFNTFEDANEFYTKMVERLSLTEDTYKNKRYVQLESNDVPEFTKEVYLDLITNFNIF